MTTAPSFEMTHRRISADVRSVFQTVAGEAGAIFEETRHKEIREQHASVSERVGRLVELKRKLLRETLIKYLGEDALQALHNEPAAVQNRYFEARAQWIPEDRGRRTQAGPAAPAASYGAVVAAGAGVTIAAATRAIAGSSLALPLIAGSGAAIAAWHLAQHLTRRSLADAVTAYVRQAEEDLLGELESIAAHYEREFDRFVLTSSQKGAPERRSGTAMPALQ